MRATSGLSHECLGYLGRPLEVRFVYGWGWGVSENYWKALGEFPEIESINGNTAEITPRRFYRHYGVLRAFKADIVFPTSTLDGMEVLAYSLANGFDWNFSTRICPLWGFLFGKGEPQFPFWKSPYPWPRIYKNGIIGGYGEYIRNNEPNPEGCVVAKPTARLLLNKPVP